MTSKSIIQTEHPHIIKAEGMRGGSPIIKGTGMPVWCIVGYRKIGMSVEEILENFPHLTLAQIHDALSYYYDHFNEIEEEWRICNDEEYWMKKYPPGVYKKNE
ncbi:MAG: DUF433 domain-containing protein [Methanosarcinales archaeon]